MATSLSSGTVDTSNSNTSENTPHSNFQPIVCLRDWWLIKAEKDFNGKRLAVAGFRWDDPQSMKLFSSAPITRRHDMFTLEAADGITISIEGSMNWSRAHENGISSEVCYHFVIGFPIFWEDSSYQSTGEESTAALFTTSKCGLPKSWGNLKDGNSKGMSYKEKTGDFGSEAYKNLVLEVNMQINSPLDVELNTAKDNLNGDRVGDTETILNPLIRNRKCSTEKLGTNNSYTLMDDSVSIASDLDIVNLSEWGMGSPGNSSRRLSTFKRVQSITNTINKILSSRSTGPNYSVPKDQSMYGEENLDDKVVTYRTTRKRKAEYITDRTSPPFTRNRSKMLSCVSPDCGSSI